jgi:hypothetical protein
MKDKKGREIAFGERRCGVSYVLDQGDRLAVVDASLWDEFCAFAAAYNARTTQPPPPASKGEKRRPKESLFS